MKWITDMKNKRLMGMIALLVVLVVGGIIYSSVNGEKAPKTIKGFKKDWRKKVIKARRSKLTL